MEKEDSPTALCAARTNDEIENTSAQVTWGVCVFDLAVRS